MVVATVRAVVFDVGLTLWYPERNPTIPELAGIRAADIGGLLARWGVPAPDPLIPFLCGIWEACDAAWRHEDAIGSLREIDMPDIVRAQFAAHGTVLDRAQAEEIWRVSWLPSREHMGMVAYPDAVDVLRELKRRGVLVGVNTNRPCTAEMLHPDLVDFGLAPFVDAAVCSGDVGFVKPHPATFELISQRLGVPSGDIAMVGDSCKADMAGGRRAGMRTALKRNGSSRPELCADAEFEIDTLSDLLALPIIPSARS